jgi:aminopeptidase-like protein
MTTTTTHDAVEPADGEAMYRWAQDLYPLHRSLTGPGVRATLDYLRGLLPGLGVHEVPSGTPAFDWTVPDEWTLRDAYVEDVAGQRVIDVRRHNLHVVGYSAPVDRWVSREELDAHLHSLPEMPDAIPYVTSYYERRWGFCVAHRDRVALTANRYRVVIDADLAPGVMNVGELVVPGHSAEEVLLSTNICHPSLANNEVSGLVMLAALARWSAGRSQPRYTHRFLFLPETIGAIWYLSRHADLLRERVVAGYVVTCVGDDRAFSFVPSRAGDTLADRVARNVLRHRATNVTHYSFLDRGSDERQFCGPGIDLPVCSVMRSRYATYPEYHTSLDDLSVISPRGLQGAFDALTACLRALDADAVYRTTVRCEPQLGRRGLYATLSDGRSALAPRPLLDLLAYADGTRDLVALADTVGMDVLDAADHLRLLGEHGLVTQTS